MYHLKANPYEQSGRSEQIPRFGKTQILEYNIFIIHYPIPLSKHYKTL